MRERTATDILAGGMLALLLSAAAAAEPDDRPEAELPTPFSEVTLSAIPIPVSFEPAARPPPPASRWRREPPRFDARRVLRYEQPLQWDEVDLIFRIRALRSSRRLVVVELRF